MNEFLGNSQIVLNNIKRLREIVSEMEEHILLKQNSVLSDEKEEVLENKISKLDFDFNSISEIIGKEIKKNQQETDGLEGKISDKELEIRRNHIYKHTKDLKEVIGEYRNLKCSYKNKEVEMLKRAFEVVHPNAKDEDFEEFKTKLGDDSTPFAIGASDQSLKHAKVRKERLDRVIEVINKLVMLIEEIDELVKNNSKVVDNIVIHMTDAEINTNEANNQLEAALKYQRRANKIKRIIYGILIFIFILFIIWLFGSGFFSGGRGKSTIYINGTKQDT